jgi:hypothetical protein
MKEEYFVCVDDTTLVGENIVPWMARALFGNRPVNTLDTRSQQWNNEVMQPPSKQPLSKQTSAQAQ